MEPMKIAFSYNVKANLRNGISTATGISLLHGGKPSQPVVSLSAVNTRGKTSTGFIEIPNKDIPAFTAALLAFAGIKEETPKDRLEYLRGELRGERISYEETHELQSLASHIDPEDVELLEAAGVPESAPRTVKDLKALLNRAAAAIETPADLNAEELKHVAEDLAAAAEALDLRYPVR